MIYPWPGSIYTSTWYLIFNQAPNFKYQLELQLTLRPAFTLTLDLGPEPPNYKPNTRCHHRLSPKAGPTHASDFSLHLCHIPGSPHRHPCHVPISDSLLTPILTFQLQSQSDTISTFVNSTCHLDPSVHKTYQIKSINKHYTQVDPIPTK